MRLYHGTSRRHLDHILENGLLPRAERKSNWNATSCEDVVYLTKTYGLHFAYNARLAADEELLIVEIDSDLLPDQTMLLPDEDALWFSWMAGEIHENDVEQYVNGLSQEEQAQWFGGFLEEFNEQGFTAEWSLKFLGNCSYKGSIPPSAITRIAAYEPTAFWWYRFHDPQVSPSNFRFCGSEYEATQLITVDRLDEAKRVPQLFPMMLGPTLSLDDIDALCKEHRTLLEVFGENLVAAPAK
jgi:hypothetical protein